MSGREYDYPSYKKATAGVFRDGILAGKPNRLVLRRNSRLRLVACILGACLITVAVSLAASAQETRGSGDFVMFDILGDVGLDDSRPAGGGGGDIVVFDIVDAAVRSSARSTGDGGGDIIVFDIVDSVVPTAASIGDGDDVADLGVSKYTIYVLAATEEAGVYEVVLDTGEKMVFGLLGLDVTSSESEAYTFWLWLESGSGLADFVTANSSTIASSGYIRVKKLNSGG